MNEIDRLEEFLKYQQQGDATTYLFNWSRHQQVRAELHDFRFFRSNIDVQLDAKITGNIAVIVDEDKPLSKSTTPAHSPQKRPQVTSNPPANAQKSPMKVPELNSELKHARKR
jgi:hypothetical protein